jgi:meiotically up-regulated gene 157 (Mug157) protein
VAGLQDLLGERGVPPARSRLVLRATQLLLRRGISMHDDGSAFVITGDIPAMWLRDSAAQVAPLLALATRVPASADLVRSVLLTQVRQVLIDPRANAFNPEPNGATIRRDFRPQSPWVFERKYALDSLCAPLSLAWRIWRATGSLEHVDEPFRQAARIIVSLWRHEQQHDSTSYVLLRRVARHGDSLSEGGHGGPVGRTGMTWSGFRPSDDACTYGYHVPANAFAAVSLGQLADLLDLVGDQHLAADARLLAAEIRQAILASAVVDLPGVGRGFAYEIDGLGHALLMDDANLPSLLSLPYLGFCDRGDPLYRATRAWVLSPRNPTWASGRAVTGVGSSHTRAGWPWPLAILVEGLTAADVDEREGALRRAEVTTSRDGLFHESVHADDPRRFSRRWFSWADMLHVELVLRSAGVEV